MHYESNPEMSRTILVVDDDPPMRAIIDIMLRREGYDVVQAEDGREALRLLETLTPDALIVDVMMPRMDGLTLCRELRTKPQTQKLPVLILSVLSDPHSRQNGLEAGADRYLSKPVLRRQLVGEVANLLS
ncbi:MAG: response regulator [Anaerolineae bacterium]|nr:response regulator [Anaerolineae bacterium]